MAHRRQGPLDPLPPNRPAGSSRRAAGGGKKNATSLAAELDRLLACTAQATTTASCAARLREHLWAALLCPERRTVTNLLCASGRTQQDWSAAYRLYADERVDESVLFGHARHELLAHLPPPAPLVVALDDTLTRKSGARIHGVGWRRDPLGPAFQTNLVRGQRYLQFSAAWPLTNGEARLVPIGFYHVPPAGKPPRNAEADTLAQHRREEKRCALPQQTLAKMVTLRQQCDPARRLIFSGDGGYTNAAVLKGLPQGTTYLGRCRKDAKLHYLPSAPPPSTGRRPSYGALAPTPEALRTDDRTPWQEVEAFAAGRRHTFKIKTLGPVLWRKSGAARPVRVLVIAPLGYRLRQGGKLLYRQPAYLLCTDPELPVADLLQYYLWRWGIEVNFREEKTLLGTGEAQVRTAASNQHLPAALVAAYALLWVAALRRWASDAPATELKTPKWRVRTKEPAPRLPSTGDLLRTLRFECWAGQLDPKTFEDFVITTHAHTKPEKLHSSLPGTLFAAA